MNSASLCFKLKLIISTGILAGVVSAVSGWEFFFVWYMLAIICIVVAAVAWGFSELIQLRR